MKIIAALTDPSSIRRYLHGVGLPAWAPPSHRRDYISMVMGTETPCQAPRYPHLQGNSSYPDPWLHLLSAVEDSWKYSHHEIPKTTWYRHRSQCRVTGLLVVRRGRFWGLRMTRGFDRHGSRCLGRRREFLKRHRRKLRSCGAGFSVARSRTAATTPLSPPNSAAAEVHLPMLKPHVSRVFAISAPTTSISTRSIGLPRRPAIRDGGCLRTTQEERRDSGFWCLQLRSSRSERTARNRRLCCRSSCLQPSCPRYRIQGDPGFRCRPLDPGWSIANAVTQFVQDDR